MRPIAKQYEERPGPMGGKFLDYGKAPVRTMPLCKFLELAHYNSGKGPVGDAANWICPPHDTSMLNVGESGQQAGVIQ